MLAASIPLQRLVQQRILPHPLETPGEVVAWLGAVQAQNYLESKWALGLRLHNATDDLIERAFADGSILRTHVMRPTWHFVAPADIRWMLELTAPRVNRVNASQYRGQKLDEALFARSGEVIAKALQGRRQLTRAELGSALAEAGILAGGIRLAYIIMRAELDGVVCSGPRRGKQFTYALLGERAPQARILERDEALAELTRRYYTGHGPATLRDFAWWSGLTIADAKAGLEMNGSLLAAEVMNGQAYWFSSSMPPVPEVSQSAFLLPAYDEFLVGFDSTSELIRGSREPSQVFDPAIVIGDRIAGSWKRTFMGNSVLVELAPFARLSSGEEQAVAAAARRYGEFLGMPVKFL
ncbi:MAG: winged helix DNA-binding domain-containing protein [Omnitrophica WOR_2 bacterium]